MIENVTTGAEALEQLKFEKFDLIILDGQLPDMLGIDICRSYRDSGGMTPVLMLSGQSNEDQISAGLQAGSNDYLAKPFVMAELSKRIDALVLVSGESK